MIKEAIFKAGQDEVNASGLITDKAMIDWLNVVISIGKSNEQEDTKNDSRYAEDADTQKEMETELDPPGVAWMVINWKVQYLRRPKLGEEVLVRTWSRDYIRTQAYRDYEILDEEGNCIVKAASVWIAVDPIKGMVLRLTPEIMGYYGTDPDRCSFPGYAFPKYRKLDMPTEKEADCMVTDAMIDENGHVHNSDYLTFAAHILPDNCVEAGSENLEINFRKEILPGASVKAEYCLYEDRHMVVIRSADRATVHAVVTNW